MQRFRGLRLRVEGFRALGLVWGLAFWGLGGSAMLVLSFGLKLGGRRGLRRSRHPKAPHKTTENTGDVKP